MKNYKIIIPNFFKGLFYMLLLFSLKAHAQEKYSANWYFGAYAGITFNTPDGTPVSISQPSAMAQAEGVASISDKDGNLLFYTNGLSVWNRNHEIITSGLPGSNIAAQSVVVAKQPGENNNYYLFTTSDWESPNGLSASVVDMNLNGGLGGLVDNSSVLLIQNSAESVSATFHSNGEDIWIVAHTCLSGFSNSFKSEYQAFLLTEQGLTTQPVTTEIGGPYQGVNRYGYLRFNSIGTKLASALGGDGANNLELFDFNNSTGKLSNRLSLLNLYSIYCAEFSPDNSKLYAVSFGGNVLYGYDLNSSSVIASQQSIALPFNANAIQLGPDGKIYIAGNGSEVLKTLDNPNADFADLNFPSAFVQLLEGTHCGIGLPNFVTSYLNPLSLTATSVGNCLGSPTNFTAVVMPSGTQVMWTFGDATTGTGLDPVHTYSALGSYEVIATAVLGGFERTFAFNHEMIQCSTQPPCAECVSSFSPEPGQRYLLSAWVKETYTGNTPENYLHGAIKIHFNQESITLPVFYASGPIIDGWQRIEKSFIVPLNASNIQIELLNINAPGDVFFDDIRIHPFESNMKSFVYNPSTQKLVAELDENNYATLYEYDDEGILIRVKKETERGVMTIKETRMNQSKIKSVGQ